jgi:hypothetical protein
MRCMKADIGMQGLGIAAVAPKAAIGHRLLSGRRASTFTVRPLKGVHIRKLDGHIERGANFSKLRLLGRTNKSHI